MTDNEKVLQRASEILSKFRVAKILADLKEYDVKYKSTQLVDYSRDVSNVGMNDDIVTGTILKRDEHEIVIGFSKFDSPVALTATTYADVHVYFDEELVFHTSTSRTIVDYGTENITVDTRPSSLKAFKAGPWLELLGKCYDELVEARENLEEKKRQDGLAEQASNIDLGDYE